MSRRASEFTGTPSGTLKNFLMTFATWRNLLLLVALVAAEINLMYVHLDAKNEAYKHLFLVALAFILFSSASTVSHSLVLTLQQIVE